MPRKLAKKLFRDLQKKHMSEVDIKKVRRRAEAAVKAMNNAGKRDGRGRGRKEVTPEERGRKVQEWWAHPKRAYVENSNALAKAVAVQIKAAVRAALRKREKEET